MVTSPVSKAIADTPKNVVALAQYVSFAVRVDPALLRAARLKLFPASEAGLEADLWLSPLIRFRMPSGITLDDDVARELRQQLWDGDKAAYQKAWDLTRAMHAHMSPAIQLEEELAYLEPRNDAEAEARTLELLQKAVAAMVGGEHKGLAHWAARALPRLSHRMRTLEPAQMLAAGATARLGGRLSSEARNTPPDWMSWVIPPSIPRIVAGVRLLNGGVEIGDPKQLTDAREIKLPRTEPLLLTVIQSAGPEQTVEIPPHLDRVVRVPISEQAVRLRTLLGEIYLLDARSGAAAARRAAEILDMTPEREPHREFVGREPLLAHVDAMLSSTERLSPWVVLTGGEGTGKSAAVAQVLSRLESRGICAPHHFFNRWIPRLRDPEAAVMSICAQIEQRYPELASSEAHARTRLSGLLGRIAARSAGEKEQVVIVLDGLDAIDPLGRRRLLDFLPAHVAEGVSYLASTTDPANLRDLTGRSHHEVIDLGDAQWSDPRAMLEYLSRRKMPFDVARISGFERWPWLAVKILETWALERDPSELAALWSGVEDPDQLVRIAVELTLNEAAAREGILPVVAVSREAIPETFARQLGLDVDFERLPAPVRGLIVRRELPDGALLMPVSGRVREAVEAAASELARRTHELVVANLDTLPRDFQLRQALYHASGAYDEPAVEQLTTDPKYLQERIALEGTGHLIEELEGVAHEYSDVAQPRGDQGSRVRQLFLSYRREDAQDSVGRLYDDLVQVYGSDRVIMDLDQAPLGIDFVSYMREQISRTDAVLVIIGKRWLTASDTRRRSFRRRLDDGNDFIRLEIRTAFERNIPVIPVLVQDAVMPRETDLPEDIRPLARRQASTLRSQQWRADVDRLVDRLNGLDDRAARRTRQSKGEEAV